jgi:glutamate dehydrogenase
MVAQLARERDSELLARFVGAYLRRAPSADAEAPEEEPEALLAEARGAFALADGRGSAIVGVRAFTPRREEHGYESAGSVLETNTDDLPFLVDSVGAELAARGLRIVRVTHPIVGVRRDSAPPHRIIAIEHPRDAPRESVMHFELDRRLSPEELADVEDAARHVLATVRAVVNDFPAMQGGLDRLVEIAAAGAARLAATEQDPDEVTAFLRWAGDGHFVFLGFHEDTRDADGRLHGGGGGGGLHPPHGPRPVARDTRGRRAAGAITRSAGRRRSRTGRRGPGDHQDPRALAGAPPRADERADRPPLRRRRHRGR